MVKAKKQAAKEEKVPEKLPLKRVILITLVSFCLLVVLFSASFLWQFENMYRDKVYPGITIDGTSFGGKTPEEVELYFDKKNQIFRDLLINLNYQDKQATLSGELLKAGFDVKLSSIQAYSLGRSGNILSDFYQKWIAKTRGIRLE